MESIKQKMVSLMEKPNVIYKLRVSYKDGRPARIIRCWRQYDIICRVKRYQRSVGQLLPYEEYKSFKNVSLVK